jgi:hypothetical protein
MNDPVRLIDDDTARKALGFDVRSLPPLHPPQLAEGEARLLAAIAQGATPAFDPTAASTSLFAGVPAAVIGVVAATVVGGALWLFGATTTTTTTTTATTPAAPPANTVAALEAPLPTIQLDLSSPSAPAATTPATPTTPASAAPKMTASASPRRPPVSEPSRTTPPLSTLVEQARLVEDARAALRDGQAAVALERCDRLLSIHPRGELVPEARVVRLEALLMREDLDAVVAEADRFLATSESEPYRARVLGLRARAVALR